MKGKRNVRNGLVSVTLAIVLILSMMPMTTYAVGERAQQMAAKEEVVACAEVSAAPEVGLPENETLFEGYVEGRFYGDGGISAYSVGDQTAGAKLSGDEKVVYDILLPWVKAVAAGETSSSVVTVGSKFTIDGTEYQPNFSAAFTGMGKDFNLTAVVRALLVDCPYEMYWYDKTKGCQMQYGADSAGELVYIALKFVVAEDYRGADELTVASAYRVNAAYEEAQRVVQAYSGASDYEKLVAYKDYLCQNVDYNNEVAGSDAAYGDPWQLIYVFDQDPDTKVVCEGYAKAFQYLCDQSTFAGDISCYCVTGYLTDRTGTAAHMWNVVTMEDGRNYLLDVTNIDGGYDLFLVGGEMKQQTLTGVTETGALDGYEFTFGSNTVGYYYDKNNVWSADVLSLYGTRYVPSQTSTFAGVAITPGSGTWTMEDTLATPLFTIAASEYDSLEQGTEVYVSTDDGANWNAVVMTKKGTIYQSNKTLQAVLGNAVGSVEFKVKLTADTHEDWISTKRTAILSPLQISDVNTELSFVGLHNDSCYYTGKAQTPESTLLIKSGEVTAYSTTSDSNDGIVTFSYLDNINVGTATVTVRGNGQQVIGSAVYPFTIARYDTTETAAASDLNWTKDAVVVTAPTGYEISRSIDGTYAESITVTEQSDIAAGTKVDYYLKTKAQGYITSVKTLTVKIDKTAPQFTEESGVKIASRDAWWQELLTKLTFGIYGSQSVTIHAEDTLSGVKEYYYYVDRDPVDVKTAAELDGVSFTKSENGSFGLSEDGSYVVYAYAVDQAGNQSAYISSEGITIDTTVQEIDFDKADVSVSQEELPLVISESLKAAGFQTIDEIKEALCAALQNAGVILTGENVAYYEVTLEYSLDGGITWTEATTKNIPQGGVLVKLKYPEGTGKDTHDFVVIHMFGATDNRLGITAGDTEQPQVIKTEEGIEVILSSCSPIGIAWTEIDSETDDSGAGTDDGISDGAGTDGDSGTTDGAGTGDDSGAADGTGTSGATGTTGGASTNGTSGTANGTTTGGTTGNTKGTGTSGTTTTVASTKVATGDVAQPIWYLVFAALSMFAIGGVCLLHRKCRL